VAHDPGSARDARSHGVELAAGSRAAAALGGTVITVNSFHHQAVDRLAGGLVASGWSTDGLIEAAESSAGAPWLLAVQWHPEEMHAEAQVPDRGLFRALVEAAGARGAEAMAAEDGAAEQSAGVDAPARVTLSPGRSQGSG
jgi:putative glutamine amidotransferase